MQYILAVPSHKMQLSAWYKHSCRSEKHTVHSKALYLPDVCWQLDQLALVAAHLIGSTANLL